MTKEDEFPPESHIQCAAYIGGEYGRCPNMGLREYDEVTDVGGIGRLVWISWCAFHYRPNNRSL